MANTLRYALITGATGTFGQALVQELASHYDHFFLLGRHINKLEVLDDSLKRANCTATLIPQDFTAPFDLSILRNHIHEKTKALHFFAACAVTHPKAQPFKDVALTSWLQTFQVNFSVNVMLIKGLMPFFQHDDLAYLLFPSCRFLPAYDTAYAASKAALDQFIENVAQEYVSRPHLKWCLANPGLMQSPLLQALYPGYQQKDFPLARERAQTLLKHLFDNTQAAQPLQKIDLDKPSSPFTIEH